MKNNPWLSRWSVEDKTWKNMPMLCWLLIFIFSPLIIILVLFFLLLEITPETFIEGFKWLKSKIN